MTNFEKMLALVPLESNAKVVDIGAGGFEGETTTKHLVDRFDWVVAVDKNRDRALKLADKFDKEKLGIIVCTLEDFEPLHPYDLMVIDLDEGQIPWIFKEAIPKYGSNIVKFGGYVITLSDETSDLTFISHRIYNNYLHEKVGWLSFRLVPTKRVI